MSNIFKSNSRFSVLVDDIPIQNNNSKKDKEEKNERFNSFKSERESPFINYREQEQKEKERIKQESLKIENFPDLLVVSNKKVMEDIKKVSYIEKLQKEDDTKKYIDTDLENLKPGWILLKSDPLTRRTIIKHHPEINIIEKKKKTEKTETEIAMDVLNVLVELHEKRTREYIDNFGYDEWERMFKFPDWIEREAYLEQMENETNDSEYEYEDEDEDEYEYED